MSNYLVAIHIIELLAALAGTYYYLKTRDYKIRIFIWYLWIIVGVETFGMYGYILQNNYDNTLFIWIKNSVFCSNTWLYNLYSFFSVILLGLFFSRNIDDDLSKKIIKLSIFIYTLSTIGYFIVSGAFFKNSLPYDVFLQTFVVFIFVMIYYKQLLISDNILVFYKLPLFYLSSGLLLWYLSVTPIFIFNSYLNILNPNFYEFRQLYLLIANTFLYSCYIFGFLYTLQYKKQ